MLERHRRHQHPVAGFPTALIVPDMGTNRYIHIRTAVWATPTAAAAAALTATLITLWLQHTPTGTTSGNISWAAATNVAIVVAAAVGTLHRARR